MEKNRRRGPAPASAQWPYFRNSHSTLQSGHTCRVLSHREMQCMWNAWLHTPVADVHSARSSSVISCSVAWSRAPWVSRGVRGERRGCPNPSVGADRTHLALDAQLHDVVPADGAVVHVDVYRV